MADDAEVLDWGGEDDEHYGGGANRIAGTGDIDDVVSIGGEEDDMQELAAFQERAFRDSGNEESPPAGTKDLPVLSEKTTTRRDSGDVQPPPGSPPSNTFSLEAPTSRRSARRRSESRSRSTKAPLTHALPPKPSVAPSSSTRSSGFAGARVMSDSKRSQETENNRKRTNGSILPLSESLPADWEIRHSTSGEVYYYNVRTMISQWHRPSFIGKVSSTSPRELTRDEFADLRADNKLSRTQSASDMHPERAKDAYDSRSSEKARPASPIQDLSYDDRHYRPSNGAEDATPRPSQRERRDTSPPFTFRGVPLKGSSDPQGRNRQERDTHRPYAQRSEGNEAGPRRNSPPRLSDIPAFSRNNLRGDESGRIAHGGGGFDRGRGRGRGSGPRRSLGPPQDIRLPQERFANDRMRESQSDNQFKDPPPRPADDTVLPSHRRHRSRSPPHLRRSASFRNGDDANRSYEEHNSERDTQSRLPSSSRFEQHPSLQRQWNQPLIGRRDSATPSMNFDSPARRPREYESSEASKGVDTKRRRVGSVTASLSFSRRGRSPSPMEMRDDTFRPDPYIDEIDSQHPSRGKNNDGNRLLGATPTYRTSSRDEAPFPPRKGFGDTFDRSRDVISDNRSTNSGPIPQGPRQRTDSFITEAETREIVDSGVRQTHSIYQQEGGGQPRREMRNFGDRPPANRALEMGRHQEAMDIDSPRPRMPGPPPNAGSMYSDRMREPIEKKETEDRLPTGPRAMHSKESVPPSPRVPIPPLTSQASIRTSPRSPVFDGRRSPPGSRGRRSSRFSGRESDFQAFTDHDESAMDDRRVRSIEPREHTILASSSAPSNEPYRGNDWRAPVPSGPRFLQEKPSFQRRPPSPMLSGTNNIPITPRKVWKVDNVPSDTPTIENGRGGAIPNESRVHSVSDQLPPVGRGIHSPEARYKNLHGDVERRMSLSDKNNIDSENRFSSYNKQREIDKPEQQHEKIHPLGSQNSRRSGPRIVSTAQISRKRSEADVQTCQSRFSRPQSDIPVDSPKESNEEPRLWIPRGEPSGHKAPNGASIEEERRARSPPPRSADSTRKGSRTSLSDEHEGFDQPLVDRTFVRGPPPPQGVRASHTMLPPPSPPAVRRSPPPRSPVEFRDRQVNDPRAIPSSASMPTNRHAPYGDRELRNRMETRPIQRPLDGDEALRSINIESGLHEDRPNDDSTGPDRLPPFPTTSSMANKHPSPSGNSAAEEPRITTNPPLRIKRPVTKAGDLHQQSSRFEARHPEAFETNGHQEHPSQLRSNSLLERLNMNEEASTSSVNKATFPPSLRDRVELPAPRGDGNSGRVLPISTPEDRSGPPDGNLSYSEGYRGRGYNRGRGRGGRGRRGRGRGGFNDS